jgi:hypothetical protein
MTHQFAFTPFRMKKDMAAFYCGYVSISSFDRAVSAGEIPAGKKATGGTFWLRDELEACMVQRNVKKPNFGVGI